MKNKIRKRYLSKTQKGKKYKKMKKMKKKKKKKIRNRECSVKPIFDPQMYEDIYEYIRNMELRETRPVRQNILENMKMDVRPDLVDWLADVAQQYKLRPETLHLCISCMDRYLTTNALIDMNIGHLALTCLLIAGKYEEARCLTIKDLCLRVEYPATKQQLVQMEADVLKALKYEIGYPTAHSFVRGLTEVDQEDSETFLSYYLAELSLVEYRCIEFLPSLVAASAIFLARFTFNPGSHPWNLPLEQLLGYKPSDLEKCVRILHALQLGTRYPGLHAIREKYKQPKFKSVSKLPSRPEIPICFFDDVEGC